MPWNEHTAVLVLLQVMAAECTDLPSLSHSHTYYICIRTYVIACVGARHRKRQVASAFLLLGLPSSIQAVPVPHPCWGGEDMPRLPYRHIYCIYIHSCRMKFDHVIAELPPAQNTAYICVQWWSPSSTKWSMEQHVLESVGDSYKMNLLLLNIHTTSVKAYLKEGEWKEYVHT